MKSFASSKLLTLLVCLTFNLSFGLLSKKDAKAHFQNEKSLRGGSVVNIDVKENFKEITRTHNNNNKQRSLDADVIHIGTVVVDYEFADGDFVFFPLESERRGIERITQVWYRQVYAGKFPAPYHNVFVAYSSEAIVNNLFLRVFYTIEIQYRNGAAEDPPSLDESRAASVAFDFEDYRRSKVVMAEPADGLFSFCTALFVFTQENSFASISSSTNDGGSDTTSGGGSSGGDSGSSGGDSGSSGSGSSSSGSGSSGSGSSGSDSGSSSSPAAPLASICFSGETTVDVEGRGSVKMSALNVGDRVNIGDDEYSTVYGFGHLDKSSKQNYVRVHAKGKDGSRLAPLEISDKHMIPIKGSTTDASRVATTLQANKLQLNDVLYGQGGNSEFVVTKLDRVTRTGAYLPLTSEGKVLVNGVVASTYVSIFEDAPSVINMVNKVVSDQTLFGWFISPLRLMCGRMSFTDVCTNDSMFDEETGIWHYLLWGQRLTIAVDGTHAAVQACAVVLALAVLASVNALEWLWTMRYGTVAVLTALYLTKKRRIRKESEEKKSV